MFSFIADRMGGLNVPSLWISSIWSFKDPLMKTWHLWIQWKFVDFYVDEDPGRTIAWSWLS
jgi:hypothetical protein